MPLQACACRPSLSSLPFAAQSPTCHKSTLCPLSALLRRPSLHADDDRAMLNTLRFESPESAGAGATCTFEMSGSDDNQPTATAITSSAVAHSEAGTASSSTMDGTLQSATLSASPAMEYPGESDVASSAAAAVEAGAAAGAAAMGAIPCNVDATTAVAAHALARQVPDASVMLQCTESGQERVCVQLPPFALRAGARDTVYFDPAKVKAAIVVTGGPWHTLAEP